MPAPVGLGPVNGKPRQIVNQLLEGRRRRQVHHHSYMSHRHVLAEVKAIDATAREVRRLLIDLFHLLYDRADIHARQRRAAHML